MSSGNETVTFSSLCQFEMTGDSLRQIYHENISKYDINDRNEFGRTALINCIMFSDLDACSFLIEEGANVNLVDKAGKSPLLYTITPRKLDKLNLVLDSGCKITQKDKEGYNCLLAAAKKCTCENESSFIRIFHRLVFHGADLTYKRCGKSALMYAVQNGCVGLFKFLMSRNVIYDDKDDDGMTALHFATLIDHEDEKVYENLSEISKILLEKGLSVTDEDIKGRKPMDIKRNDLNKGLFDLIKSSIAPKKGPHSALTTSNIGVSTKFAVKNILNDIVNDIVSKSERGVVNNESNNQNTTTSNSTASGLKTNSENLCKSRFGSSSAVVNRSDGCNEVDATSEINNITKDSFTKNEEVYFYVPSIDTYKSASVTEVGKSDGRTFVTLDYTVDNQTISRSVFPDDLEKDILVRKENVIVAVSHLQAKTKRIDDLSTGDNIIYFQHTSGTYLA